MFDLIKKSRRRQRRVDFRAGHWRRPSVGRCRWLQQESPKSDSHCKVSVTRHRDGRYCFYSGQELLSSSVEALKSFCELITGICVVGIVVPEGSFFARPRQLRRDWCGWYLVGYKIKSQQDTGVRD